MMDNNKTEETDSKSLLRVNVVRLRKTAINSLLVATCSAFLACFSFSAAYAAPDGGNIVGGSGSINTNGLTTTINQNTSAMAIDWNSYNLSSDEIVNYLQPSSTSISLNRILGSNASEIHGQINANGQIVLVNPNGIFFGQNASINVGGLIASGLDIDPIDFMNGDYIFNEVLGTDGTVINSGLINASLGGNVTLLGKQVANEGVISAQLGSVNLAAGKAAVLTFDQQGLLGVQITEAVLQEELGLDPAVLNSGEINANGSRVLLTASVSRDVFSEAVNHDDLQQASSVVVHEDGSFTLGGGADVVNSGTINVSAEANNDAGQVVILGENVTHTGSIHADTESGLAGMVELHSMDTTELRGDALISAQATVSGSGGQIKILGENVGLFDTAEINASGVHSGGEVLVGGDRQGLNSLVRNAEFLYLGENSNIFADAITDGNGGRIITYADDTGRFYGGLYARGGALGGDGGFIETSGKKGFELPVAPDVSAVAGVGGLWLIDPYDITIVNGDGSGTSNIDISGTPYFSDGTPATLEIDTILAGLGSGDVVIQTRTGDGGGETGDIYFGDNVGINAANLNYDGITSGSLTLDAAGSIEFVLGSSIIDSDNSGDSLNVNLYANGSILLNGGVKIDTQGGDFTVGDLSGTNNTPTSFTNNGTIDTSGIDSTDDSVAGGNAGNISITVNGAVVSTALTAIGGLNDPTDNRGDSLIGANGGNITINADSVTLSGAINTSGSAARFDSNDGTGGASGGNGGVILITADTGNILTTDVISNGGDAAGDSNEPGNGGNAGNITLNSQGGLGAITSSGNINSSVGAIAGSGTDGNKSDIILNGNVTLANALDLDVNSFSSGSIDASGAAGANGNNLTIVSTNGVSISSINTQGGDVTNANGKIGGAIDLAGSSISVGAISTAGSDGSGNNRSGGRGGDILLTAIENGTVQSITIDGDLNSSGGQGTDGSGLLNGVQNTGGSIDLVLDNSGSPSGSVTINHATDFTSNVVLTGSNGIDTLTAAIRLNDWSLTNATSTLNSNLSFSDIENLVGNADTDNFVLAGGRFTGSIDGAGSGITGDSLTGINQNNDWAITAANNTGTVTDLSGTFTNIERLIGNAGRDRFTLNDTEDFNGSIDGGGGTNDRITGGNRATNTWNVLSATTGSVTGLSSTFSNVEELVGGNQQDIFNLLAVVEFTGAINGGGGTIDRIVAGNNAINSFTITGANSGTVTGLSSTFSSVENLTGNNQVDNFVISGGSLTGTIDGVLGADTLTGDNTTNTWNILTATSGDITGSGSVGGFLDIEALIGNGQQDIFNLLAGVTFTGSIDGGGGITDRIVAGDNAINDWDILSATTGSVTGLFSTFSNVEELTGNSQQDIFNLLTGLTFAGSVDGGGGTTDRIVAGNNAINSFTITGANSGTVTGLSSTFSNVENLTGNIQVDNFVISGGSLTGTINGSSGADTLTGDNTTNTWNILTATSGDITGSGSVGGFLDIEALIGNGQQDIFNLLAGVTFTGSIDGGGGITDRIVAGDNAINDWDILSATTGSVTGLSSTFSNVEELTGNSQQDIFNLLTGLTFAGSVDGGGGTTDRIVAGNNAINSFTITGANSGTVTGLSSTFSNVENLTGNNQVDNFVINGGSLVGTIDGGLGADTLTGDDAINTWNVLTATSGDITGSGSVGGFLDIEALIGNGQQDIFNLLAGVTFTGSIDGGGGITDRIVAGDNAINNFAITGANSGTVTGLSSTFTNVENLTGNNQADNFVINGGSLVGTINGSSGADTLTGDNTTNTWNILTATSGDITGTGSVGSFLNIEALTGNNQQDIFNLLAGVTFTGSIDGGGGITDRIVAGDNAINNFAITGVNSGTVTGLSSTFTNVENLTGNTQTDNFVLNGGTLTGTIDGDSGNDSLVGDNVVNSWVLTSANEGNATGVDTGNLNVNYDFTSVENLTGNQQNDTFRFNVGSSLSGNIDGGTLLVGTGENDIVDMTALNSTITVTLGSNLLNVETIRANNDATLTGQDLNNSWRVFNLLDPTVVADPLVVVNNEGTVTDSSGDVVTFSGFNNITGGTLDDTFLIESNGDITGTIDGGIGSDAIDFSAQTGVIDKTVGSTLSGLGSLQSIEGIKGNGTQSILRVSDSGSTWTIDGINAGSVISGADATIFTDFNILQGGSGADTFNVSVTGAVGDQVANDLLSRINGGAGNDEINVTLSGADAKVNLFDGNGMVSTDGLLTFSSVGPAGSDTVNINGATANFDTASYSGNYSTGQATHSYSSATTAASVAYVNVESVTDSVQAANLIINGSGNNNTVTLTGNGNVGEGNFIVENLTDSFTDVDYLNKANLTVTNLGLSGIIDITSDLNVNTTSGYFDFTADQITGSFTLSGNELRLDSILVNVDSTNPLLTDVDKLQITNSTADIFVLEIDGLNIERSDTTGLLSIISTTGDIGDSDTQGLVSSGNLSLLASSGEILLDNTTNALTGVVSLNTESDGSATFDNSGSTLVTTLGASNVGAGSLIITSTNSDIFSNQILVAETASLDAGNNNISLINTSNDFTNLDISNALSANIIDTNNLVLGDITMGSGSLQIQTAGNITQLSPTAIITQTADAFLGTAGNVTIDAGSGGIDLSNSGNDFIGEVTLNNSGSSDVRITDSNNIQFASSNLGFGNFTVNAASGISQQTGSSITQGLAAGVVNLNAGSGDIQLAQLNDFTGTVNTNNTGVSAVAITDVNSIDLGATNVGGSFDIVAAGGITQSAALTVAGNASFTANAGQIIQLDNNSNSFQQNVSFSGIGGLLQDVLIANNAALSLGDIGVVRHLGVIANGDINTSGTLNVGGVAWIGASGNAITLENNANDFNEIVFINASDVSIVDVNDIVIGSTTANIAPYTASIDSNISGSLSVTSLSGSISDNDASNLFVGGLSTFSAGAGIGDVILDASTNDFSTVDIANALNATLVDANGIDLQSTSINGNLNVAAGSDITNAFGALNVTGTSTFTAADTNSILIDNAANQLNGSLTFTASSGGSLSNVSVANTIATDIQALSVTNDLTIISGGDITQGGAFNVGNITTLTAIDTTLGPQDISLGTFTNNLNSLFVKNARDVTINNTGNALTISELNVAGAVNITSGALVATSDISGASVSLNSGNASTNLVSISSAGAVNIGSEGFNITGGIAGTDILVDAGTSAASFGGSLAATSGLNISAAGVTLNGVVNSTNDAVIDATTGTAVLGNSVDVSNGGLTVSANNIVQNSNITTASDSIFNSIQNINMGSSTSTTSSAGNIQYNTGGDVNVALLSAANGSVAANTGGQIIDSNGGATNFIGNVLEIRSTSGIGNGTGGELETQVEVMDVINSDSGDVRLIQSGSVEFVALKNTLGSGLISVVSDDNLNFNPGSVVANRDTGTLFMVTTGGSFLGVGAFDLSNADITANTATFIGLNGSFGTPLRPIVLDVPESGSVLIDTQTVSAGFFPETPADLITTGIDISVLGAVSAIAGEQLIEIESLGDIDPAIFTGLRRYSHEDIAIRMPRDQLYEDELEEGEENQL